VRTSYIDDLMANAIIKQISAATLHEPDIVRYKPEYNFEKLQIPFLSLRKVIVGNYETKQSTGYMENIVHLLRMFSSCDTRLNSQAEGDCLPSNWKLVCLVTSCFVSQNCWCD